VEDTHMLFTLDAVLFALAGTLTPFLLRACARTVRRNEAQAAATLAEAGLEAKGDLLGKFVARPVDGTGVVISNRTRHLRPGIEPLAAAPASDRR